MNIMQDDTVKSEGGVSTPNGKLETNLGGVGLVSLGCGFGNGVRTEIEGDYRYNGLNKITDVPGNGSVSGSEQKYGPMVNLLYDFNGLSPTFAPYMGAGGRYQWTTDRGSSAEGAFAYRAIPVASVPGLAVTAEYRFMGMPGNASTTAATPAPMVQPARSYLVFFDWDKATLTDRARQIIHGAAENSTHVQSTPIEVNGYTDTSGTPQYNTGLSMRRGEVRAGEGRRADRRDLHARLRRSAPAGAHRGGRAGAAEPRVEIVIQ